jgi:polysaccharide pyruvyl transferase WcaK-like protein
VLRLAEALHGGIAVMGPYALLTADVGVPERYHVGDQAIMTANLERAKRLVSPERLRIFARDPEFSASIHGVEAVEPPDKAFVRRQTEKRSWRDPLGMRALLSRSRGALRTVARASLLHLCGGGNLTSLFKHEIQLRSLYALVALEAGVPVIVTGQTIGPDLDPEDRQLLTRWLPRVSYLGTRDRRSAQIASELAGGGSEITTVADDAYFMTGQKTASVELEARIEAGKERPVVGLSLHHRKSSELDADKLSSSLARALDALAEQVEIEFLFLSHLHSVTGEPTQWDLRFGAEICRKMRHGDRVHLVTAPLIDREVKHLSTGCEFFVSTRYHGAVFALSGGVPTLSLTQDDHTRVKMHGLLDTLGLEAPVLGAESPELGRVLLQSWERRDELRKAALAATDRAHAPVERESARIAEFYQRML